MAAKKPSDACQNNSLEQTDATAPQSQESPTADPEMIIAELEDEVAERKCAGKTLALSQERIRRLSRRTLELLEADRRSISKELHDSIGASLAAIKFSLEEKELTRKQSQGRLDESLDQEIAYLLKAIKETKRISANLRPTTLDDLGLMATIDWFLRQFKIMYGDIQIDYSAAVEERDIPEDMQIVIYRIIQEGLSNAEKHSEARMVRVRLSFGAEHDTIALDIEDDGIGFDVAATISKKDPLSGYGLTAMIERCEIYGGRLWIDSNPDQGTRIYARLPRN
jgi:signal transduction histidine kinase